MRYNKVSTVVSDVIQYAKHQIELTELTDEIENGINMRFVSFEFHYKGCKCFVTARYEVGTVIYKSINMSAGFEKTAALNNYYYELVRVMSHLRTLFNV